MGHLIVVASLILVGLDENPSDLVRQLGSARIGVRERAAQRLVELGADALPALRAACNSSDPEIQERARRLSADLEKHFLISPTLIQLPARAETLRDLLNEIGRSNCFQLGTVTPSVRSKLQLRVGCKETAPVPFWSAIDRICAGTGVRFALSSEQESPFIESWSARPVSLTVGGTAGPHCDAGSVRVRLLSITERVVLSYDEPSKQSPRPNSRKGVRANIVVWAEPRLAIKPRGEPIITEVRDENGLSMPPPVEGLEKHSDASGTVSPSPVCRFYSIPLPSATESGRFLRRIRGTIPVKLAARRPETLNVPLKGAVGHVLSCSEASIEIERLEADDDRMLIEFVVRPRGGLAELVDASEAASLENDVERGFSERLLLDRQLDVLDQGGNICLAEKRFTLLDGGSVRVTLRTMSPPIPTGAVGPPALAASQERQPIRLRYLTLARADYDVAFEFNDIPMP